MNGAQDMGGKHGFGPVHPEPNEPVFHAEWEKRAFALTLAMGMPGGWNIDMSRFARENRPPTEYLSMSYYQIWYAALEHMIKERGLVSDDEVAAGHSLRPPKPVNACFRPPTSQRLCTAAGRPIAKRIRKPSSSPAIAFGRKTSTPLPTLACLLTCAATSAPSSA